MASPRILWLTFSLLLVNVVNSEPVRVARTPKKRSIPYTFRTSPARVWTSSPSLGLAGGQLLVDTSGLGAFTGPLESPLLPRMTAAVVAPPPEVPPPQPATVAYLPLPALLAALRGMTPAAVGAGQTVGVCLHTHPVGAAPVGGLSAGDPLVPGGDARERALRVLLGPLLPAANAVPARVAGGGGVTVQPSAVPDLSSLLGDLLNPTLLEQGDAGSPVTHLPEKKSKEMAAAEWSSVTERPALDKDSSIRHQFPRSVPSEPVPGKPDDQEQPSQIGSNDDGEWSNILRARRRKRYTPKANQTENQHRMSAVLVKIIRRIGFEKYSEALKLILQDMQPLKQSMRAAQSDLNQVQGAYQKFETDLNGLLEQTREAHRMLIFIMSSMFQENILLRRKLEECVASNQVLNSELRLPRQGEEFAALRQQLEQKTRQVDALVLALLTKKSALEVERQQLRQRCDVWVEPGAETDQFSLSTFLSMVTGLGQPRGAQHDLNLILAQLFPGLYRTPPPPTPPPAPKTAALTEPGRGGAGSSRWLPVLVRLMNARPPARPVGVTVPLTSPGVSVSVGQLLRGLGGRPRAAPLTAPPPAPGRSGVSGDEFIMRMLQQMLQLYSYRSGQVDERKIKEQLVSFGRRLLCL